MSRAKRVKFLKGKHLPGMEGHWVLQTQSRTGPMLCRCPTQKGLCGVLFCFVWGGGVCFIEKVNMKLGGLGEARGWESDQNISCEKVEEELVEVCSTFRSVHLYVIGIIG